VEAEADVKLMVCVCCFRIYLAAVDLEMGRELPLLNTDHHEEEA
jgi:hypothetical protein